VEGFSNVHANLVLIVYNEMMCINY